MIDRQRVIARETIKRAHDDIERWGAEILRHRETIASSTSSIEHWKDRIEVHLMVISDLEARTEQS